MGGRGQRGVQRAGDRRVWAAGGGGAAGGGNTRATWSGARGRATARVTATRTSACSAAKARSRPTGVAARAGQACSARMSASTAVERPPAARPQGVASTAAPEDGDAAATATAVGGRAAGAAAPGRPGRAARAARGGRWRRGGLHGERAGRRPAGRPAAHQEAHVHRARAESRGQQVVGGGGGELGGEQPRSGQPAYDAARPARRGGSRPGAQGRRRAEQQPALVGDGQPYGPALDGGPVPPCQVQRAEQDDETDTGLPAGVPTADRSGEVPPVPSRAGARHDVVEPDLADAYGRPVPCVPGRCGPGPHQHGDRCPPRGADDAVHRDVGVGAGRRGRGATGRRTLLGWPRGR